MTKQFSGTILKNKLRYFFGLPVIIKSCTGGWYITKRRGRARVWRDKEDSTVWWVTPSCAVLYGRFDTEEEAGLALGKHPLKPVW